MKMTFLIFVSVLLTSHSSFAQKTGDQPNLVELENRLKKNPNQTKIRETLAKAYLQKKNYDKVIELLAAYSNEVSVPSVIRLADAYEAKKDYVNQIRILGIYMQREPDAYRPYHLLGKAYRKNNQIDEAVMHLRKAIELSPKHRLSHEELLDIMLEKGDMFEARSVLAQMIRQFGKDPLLLNMQCRLYAEGGFLAEAEQSCKEALAKSKNNPENHMYLAQALMDQGRKAAAENVFKTAAKQFPNSELVQFHTGEFYFNEKNYAPAARYLEQGVKAKPDSARSLLGLALSLFEMNEWAKALPYFEKACKLDKTRAALSEFRSAVQKIRSSNKEHRLAEEYDKKIGLCQ